MKFSLLPILIFRTCTGATITLAAPMSGVIHAHFWGYFNDQHGNELNGGEPAPLDPSLPAAQFFATQISLEEYNAR